MNLPVVGPEPTNLICPSCNANVVSRISHDATTKTHLIAVVLCICLCWPCAFIPYCTDSCKNTNHYCPNCNAFLGTYQS